MSSPVDEDVREVAVVESTEEHFSNDLNTNMKGLDGESNWPHTLKLCIHIDEGIFMLVTYLIKSGQQPSTALV